MAGTIRPFLRSKRGPLRPGTTRSVTEVRQFSRLQRPVSVLVGGSEGAGKTRLVSAWADRTRDLVVETEMSTRTERNDFTVRAARAHWWQLRQPRMRVSLTTPPGQPFNVDSAEVFRDVDDPDLCPDGAIHVVCWGYNESWPGHDNALRQAKAEAERVTAARAEAARQLHVDEHTGQRLPTVDANGQPVERPRLSRADRERYAKVLATEPLSVTDALLRINRGLELESFKQVYPRLIGSWSRWARTGRRFWLVIALTKCDHYWPAVADAMRYYDSVAAPNSAPCSLLSSRRCRTCGL